MNYEEDTTLWVAGNYHGTTSGKYHLNPQALFEEDTIGGGYHGTI